MTEREYEQGLRDGRLQSLERVTKEHHSRLNHHEDRIGKQERVMWILIGAIGLIELVPALREIIGR